ncbi:MAG: transcriptional regulator FtrA [Acidocella sp.]|nr:transcriptional regulator FtrA [Acidocella sp.]
MPVDRRNVESCQPRSVVAIAYQGLGAFELGIAAEIFGLPRPEMGPDWYRFEICAVEPGPLRGLGGMSVTTETGVEALGRAHTIIIPGWRDPLLTIPPALGLALRTAHEAGTRLVSICTGAFVLAAAGVLAGRRATTHWTRVAYLAESYPDIAVDPDVLYVEDGNVFTSAGGAAGIDLCLHLVRRDFGAGIANRVAQRLVVQPQRAGSQAQIVERPVARDHEAARLGATLDYMRETLAGSLTAETLAAHASMSVRTFVRRFKEATGQSPGEWLIAERVARAKDLLESSAAPVEAVAESCGFGTAANMRRHFRQILGKAPNEFRPERARHAWSKTGGI